MQEYPKAWIEALRSGKYKQTRDFLRRGDAYCCLGVYCDISGMGSWIMSDVDGCGRYLDGVSSLPRKLRLQLKTNSRTGMLPFLGRDKTDIIDLAGLNDDGMPFSQIADLIEHFWPEL